MDARTAAAHPRVRPVRIAPHDVEVRTGSDGSVYMRSRRRLGVYPRSLAEPLEAWAARAPDRVFLAQRGAAGGWDQVTYAEALARVRGLAQALLDRGLCADRPVLILSGNSIEHGLLALACMYVGVPYAPIAPAYSLQAREFTALRQVAAQLPPALVFADDAAAFERAMAAALPPDVEIVSVQAPAAGRR